MASQDLSLERLTGPIRRSAVLIGICALIGAAIGLAAAIVVPTSYTAKSSILVSPITTDPADGLGTQAGAVDMETETEVATSITVAQRAAELVGDQAPYEGELIGFKEGATASADRSRVLVITYTANSGEAAKRGAEAFAEAYKSFRAELAADRVQAADDELQAQINEIKTNTNRVTEILVQIENDPEEGPDSALYATTELERQLLINELGTIERVQSNLATAVTDSAVIIDPARVPSGPSSLGLVPLVAGGLVGGLAVGLIAAFLLDARQQREESPDAVARPAGDASVAMSGATVMPDPAHQPVAEPLMAAAHHADPQPTIVAPDPEFTSAPVPSPVPTPTLAPTPAPAEYESWATTPEPPPPFVETAGPQAAAAEGASDPATSSDATGAVMVAAPAEPDPDPTSGWVLPKSDATSAAPPLQEIAAVPQAPTAPVAAATPTFVDDQRLLAAGQAVHSLLPRVKGRVDAGANRIFIADGGDHSSAAVALAVGHLLAEAGVTTAIVDVNMDLPTLHVALGAPLQPGIADAIVGGLQPDQILHAMPDTPNLNIAFAGTGSNDLLLQPQAASLLDTLASQFQALLLLGGAVPGSPILQGFAPPPSAVVMATTGLADPVNLNPEALREVQASCRPLLGIASLAPAAAGAPA